MTTQTTQVESAQASAPIVITDTSTVTYTLELISPERAEVYLSSNHSNRRIRPSVVTAYARDMSEGLWKDNGDSIRFDNNGKLIDGQHRLTAIVNSGVPLRTLVVRNLAADSQETIDTGPSRTSSDVFGFAGYKDSTSVALASKLGLNYQNGYIPRAGSRAEKFSHTQLLNYAADNPGLINSVEFTKYFRNAGVSRGAAAFAHYHFGMIDSELADEMFTNIADFKTSGKGDPIHAFCYKMARYKNSKNKTITPTEELYMLFRVWNALRNNESLTNVRYTSTTAFPNPS